MTATVGGSVQFSYPAQHSVAGPAALEIAVLVAADVITLAATFGRRPWRPLSELINISRDWHRTAAHVTLTTR